MTHALPPLSSLRAFEAVVRLGSVSAAAVELGRTHGAVSKQIRALQDHAGVRLFDKVGTGLMANAAGRELAAATATALDGLSEAYGDLLRQARAPAVTVACSATFAMRWLVPHMAGFSQAHPEIAIRLSMTSAREMREEKDADLVILWDRSAYPAEAQGRAIRLADAAFGVVAAPGYPLARGEDGTLEAPRRILHDHTARAWEAWTAGGGVAVRAGADISFPHTHLCIEAALSGLGVALVERRLVAQELADGRLIAPAGFIAFADGFAAIPHATRAMSRQTALLVDWLKAELSPKA
jgi:LysR family glycine cleavage system transcriptional activator